MISKAEEYYKQENYAEAENICLQMMGAGDNNVDALRLQSLVMLKTNRVQQGFEFLKLALEQDPNSADNNLALGHYSLALNNIPAAINAFIRVHEVDPTNTEALLYLGDLHSILKDWNKVVVFFALYINLDASNAMLNQMYTNTLAKCVFKGCSDVQKSAMEKVLLDDRVDAEKMHAVWMYMIGNMPDYKVLRQATEQQSFDLDALQACLNSTFFAKGIERLRQKNPTMEVALTALRHAYLARANSGNILDDHRTFLFSLSMQSWINEYVFYVTDEELAWLKDIKNNIENRIETGATNDQIIPLIYLYACYDSPFNLKGISDYSKKIDDDDFQYFVQIQINDVIEEQAIKKTIPALTDIDDLVSVDVQNMYEESPYPRRTNPVIIDKAKVDTTPYDILFAGCGTGFQVLGFSQQFPNSKYTGVDLSLSSLAYAIRQTNQKNDLADDQMRYAQADILKLDQLPDRYDRIYCTGVLHHMDDPEKGLAVLKNILKPNGEMRLALYSETARKEIVQARDYIAQQGYTQSKADIRQFRHDILKQAFQSDCPDFIKILTQIPDFYTLSECRDLVFHVQEHRYSIPQLMDMLDRHDLEFISFNISQSNIKDKFLEHFPEENAILDPMKWHDYEQIESYIFAGMYDFNVRHKEK